MGLIKMLFSKREREYVDYRMARDRRRRHQARYAAERGPETFQAQVRLADGSTWECEHAHRTRSAARACGEQHGRAS